MLITARTSSLSLPCAARLEVSARGAAGGFCVMSMAMKVGQRRPTFSTRLKKLRKKWSRDLDSQLLCKSCIANASKRRRRANRRRLRRRNKKGILRLRSKHTKTQSRRRMSKPLKRRRKVPSRVRGSPQQAERQAGTAESRLTVLLRLKPYGLSSLLHQSICATHQMVEAELGSVDVVGES